MQKQYEVLAHWYDRLMADTDYGAWCDFYEACFAKYAAEKPKSLLDLGCGTGNIALPLAGRGYEITGLDISSEMLALAAHKAEKAGVRLLLLEQNMACFDAGGTADAVICSFDGINYLSSGDDVRACFSRVAETLAENGLFIFDLSTPYKYRTVLGENTYTYDLGDLFVSWQNEYHKASGFCDFFLTFFREGADGRFSRTDEVQRQYVYGERSVKKMLEEAGLALLATCSETDFSPVTDRSEREFYICKKKGC